MPATHFVPSLDDLSGEWKDADWLAHLPSVRSQTGQALVNKDLTSVSWLASPPYAIGYHTGALKIDGQVPVSDRYRWFAYQALRSARLDGLSLNSSVRQLFDEHGLAWTVDIQNGTTETREVEIELDCHAMVSFQQDNWGWLYGQPWKNGIRHDYFTAEAQRDSITDPECHDFMVAQNARPLLLGSDGAIRDAGVFDGDGDTPMLCETELPMHTTPPGKPVTHDAFSGKIRHVALVDCREDSPASDEALLTHDDIATFAGEANQVNLGMVILPRRFKLQLDVCPDAENSDGCIAAHGNQPESLRLSLMNDHLRLDMGGDYLVSDIEVPSGQWSTVEIVFDGSKIELLIGGEFAGATTPWWDSRQWQASKSSGSHFQIADTNSAANACFAFATTPDTLELKGSGARAAWKCTLQPGERKTIQYVLHYGSDSDAVAERAVRISKDFNNEFDAIHQNWERRWRNLFTPDSGMFPGHFPILETDDPELQRVYYMTPLVMLYMLRTGLPHNDKIFLSGGPRLGPTVTFMWDEQWVAMFHALLDPPGLKLWLRNILSQDVSTFFAMDNYQGHLIGNRYAANPVSVFNTVHAYLGVTGDFDFLEETIAGKTLLELLEDLAGGWKDLRSDATGGVLADFGPDHWDLLECVPNYKHVVVSFNAGYAAMNRKLAAIHDRLGNPTIASRLREEADAIAAAVLELSTGDGCWSTLHPDGTQMVRHCLDFMMVASALADDLPAETKRQMTRFVTEELLTDNWMRAQSLLDPMVEYSDRPDHGAFGAYDGWPGETAKGLASIGAYDEACRFLRSLYPVTLESTWSQAREFVGDVGSANPDVRIAERGTNCRDAICGAATGDAIVSSLFGYRPLCSDSDDELVLRVSGENSGFTGTLHNLSYRGGQYTVHCRPGRKPTATRIGGN